MMPQSSWGMGMVNKESALQILLNDIEKLPTLEDAFKRSEEMIEKKDPNFAIGYLSYFLTQLKKEAEIIRKEIYPDD